MSSHLILFKYIHQFLQTRIVREEVLFLILGEVFSLKGDFFKDKINLTVSTQLHLETLCAGISRVYSLSPTFRAEKSQSTKHLAEFYMLEVEIAFCNEISELCNFIENLIRTVSLSILESNLADIELLTKVTGNDIKENIKMLTSKYQKTTYTEAIEILLKTNNNWEFPIIWGKSLKSEHERYLSDIHFKCPVFVIDYPITVKPFYMKRDGNICKCVDLLVPGLGELVGGSVREDDYDIIKNNAEEAKIETDLDWYLDQRKYGSFPHSGFGIGIERFLQLITGMKNIKDTIPFPRFKENCKF